MGVFWLNFAVAAAFPDPQYPIGVGERITVAAWFFVFVHGLDALTTHYIARKRFSPQ